MIVASCILTALGLVICVLGAGIYLLTFQYPIGFTPEDQLIRARHVVARQRSRFLMAIGVATFLVGIALYLAATRF